MQLERIICPNTIFRILLLIAFFYAVTCMNEDAASAGDSAEQMSSLIFSNTFLQ